MVGPEGGGGGSGDVESSGVLPGIDNDRACCLSIL